MTSAAPDTNWQNDSVSEIRISRNGAEKLRL